MEVVGVLPCCLPLWQWREWGGGVAGHDWPLRIRRSRAAIGKRFLSPLSLPSLLPPPCRWQSVVTCLRSNNTWWVVAALAAAPAVVALTAAPGPLSLSILLPPKLVCCSPLFFGGRRPSPYSWEVARAPKGPCTHMCVHLVVCRLVRAVAAAPAAQ